MEQKTRKVMDISVEGRNFVCIRDYERKYNQYILYEREWNGNGWHRRQLAKYAVFASVIDHLRAIAIGDGWGWGAV